MLLPSGRRHSSHGRGVDHATLARALVLASLVLLWDSELNGPLVDNGTADLVRPYDAQEPLTPAERKTLRRAEAGVMTASRRVWQSTRLLPETLDDGEHLTTNRHP